MDRVVAITSNGGLKKWGSDTDVAQLKNGKSKTKEHAPKKGKNPVNLFKNTFTRR